MPRGLVIGRNDDREGKRHAQTALLYDAARRQSPPTAPWRRCRSEECAAPARARAAPRARGGFGFGVRESAFGADDDQHAAAPPASAARSASCSGVARRQFPREKAPRRTRANRSTQRVERQQRLESAGTVARPHCCAAAARQAAPARQLLRAGRAPHAALGVKRKKAPPRRARCSSRRRNPCASPFGTACATSKRERLRTIAAGDHSTRRARTTRPSSSIDAANDVAAESTTSMRSPARRRSTRAILRASPPSISTRAPDFARRLRRRTARAPSLGTKRVLHPLEEGALLDGVAAGVGVLFEQLALPPVELRRNDDVDA